MADHPAKALALDTALISTTSAWALWLYRHKEFEPDWTWLQVVAGVALCLEHARRRGALAGGDWRAHQHRVFWSFVVGGTPIIVGEVAQWLEARERRRRILAEV